MKSIEHAIISSPLGINPTPDGNRIIAAIPP
jgi:ribosome recycling factor